VTVAASYPCTLSIYSVAGFKLGSGCQLQAQVTNMSISNQRNEATSMKTLINLLPARRSTISAGKCCPGWHWQRSDCLEWADLELTWPRLCLPRHTCRTTQMREPWRRGAWCTTRPRRTTRPRKRTCTAAASGDDNANPALGTVHTTVMHRLPVHPGAVGSTCGTSGRRTPSG